jgi:hypothetical protein
MEMMRQIRELAKAPNLSANDIIESAVASLQRQLLFESANQAYADLQSRPELRERQEEQRVARRVIERESIARRRTTSRKPEGSRQGR